jgi:hypothetical protein
MGNYLKDMFVEVREQKEASSLDDVIDKDFIEETRKIDIKTLINMIEEAVEESTETIAEEVPNIGAASDDEAIEMILKMIPNIEVSEIGWSDVRTPDEADEKEIKGPQRQLLEGYLSNIQGSDFADKIRSVSQFYTNGISMVEAQAGDERTKRISQAISYLVFYKTLTKVITNFNASSAGFSFESFLAALVNGYQIPANTGTIADYVDRSTGEEIPVSLKLYKEGNLEVGGSYTDLVRDLVDPKWPGAIGGAMRYVVCTKTLSGDDLEQEGRIDFYQFDISLKNVMNIIANSKQRSQECIRIPKQIASALKSGRVDGVSMADTLPGEANLPSDEDLEKIFIKYLDEAFKMKGISLSQMQTNDILQGIDYGKKDEMFNDWVQQIGEDKVNKGVVRGRSTLNKDKLRQLLQNFDWMPVQNDQGQVVSDYYLAGYIIAANNAVIGDQKKQKLADKRNQEIRRMVAEGEFLSPEESAKAYTDMGDRQKRVALENSWGYLTRGHFSLNQKQALSQGPPTSTLNLGSINVGREEVAKVVGNIRDILNEEVMEIFQSLKILSDSLNTFFAGGLSDDSLASASIDNANNISSKEILKSDK